MKKFFRERSYEMVKMFLNQFATAIFGVVLAIAAQKAENTVLRNLTSAFAVLFYLFLLYTMTWELGFKDRAGVTSGSKKKQPLTGLYISLFANIPNFVFAVFIMLAQMLDVGFISAIGGFCATAAVLLEGMYTGLLTNTFMGAALHSYWWMFFIIILPALITCTVAYLFGLNDRKFTGLFNVQYPESDRDPKQKK